MRKIIITGCLLLLLVSRAAWGAGYAATFDMDETTSVGSPEVEITGECAVANLVVNGDPAGPGSIVVSDNAGIRGSVRASWYRIGGSGTSDLSCTDDGFFTRSQPYAIRMCRNGTAESVLAVSDIDTSADIANILTDETGTGALCFATDATHSNMEVTDRINIGASPSPTPTPTATSATATATAVTPTPTVTSTPKLLVAGDARIAGNLVVTNVNGGTATLQTDWDTCAEVAANMTDETGTCGGVVLSSSPVITTPTIAQVNGMAILRASAAGVFAFQGSAGTEWARLQNVAGAINLGIATTASTYTVDLSGNAARSLGMDRHTTSNTAGNSLTLSAGGATSGATNKNGGNVVLASGLATGTGTAAVQIQVPDPVSTPASTTDKTLKTVWQIDTAGHVVTSQTLPPTLSSCGTSPTAVTGTDDNGSFTVGSVATACTLTFKTARTNAPNCVANDETSVLGVRAVATTTTIVFDTATAASISSQKIDYVCREQQ